MPFEDTTAIVTGGAQGLGLAITEALAARGTKVAIFDIDDRRRSTLQVDRLRAQARTSPATSSTSRTAAQVESRRRAGPGRPRAGADPGQQRRHRAIRQVRRDHRRAVGSRDGGQPARTVHLHPGGAARHARRAMGPHRQHLVLERPGRTIPDGRLRQLQGRGHRLHQVPWRLNSGPKGITVNTIPPGMVVTPMLEKAIDEGRFTASLDHFAKITPVRRAGDRRTSPTPRSSCAKTNHPT